MKTLTTAIALSLALAGCSTKEVIVPTATGNAEALCDEPRKVVWNRLRAYGLYHEQASKWRFITIQDDLIRMSRDRVGSGWRRAIRDWTGVTALRDMFDVAKSKDVISWSLMEETPNRTRVMGYATYTCASCEVAGGVERPNDDPEVQNVMQRVLFDLGCHL